MAHLVQSSEDIPLVENMMRKFNAQNKELRFGNFVFGESQNLRFLNEMDTNHEPFQVLSSCVCTTI